MVVIDDYNVGDSQPLDGKRRNAKTQIDLSVRNSWTYSLRSICVLDTTLTASDDEAPVLEI